MMPEYVHLKKCLYGLKQAADEWKQHLNSTLQSLNFIQCPSDNRVYVRNSQNGGKIIIGTHVDDGLIAATTQELITEFIAEMILMN